MTNYLDELNEGQRAAVVYTDGPSLVVAGAGSGKTRVLTCKIAFLLENGFQPWQILALTFTNKAAREMKQRIALQVGQKLASQLWMGTFHSIFLRMLHRYAQLLGFTNQFTVYDADDSKSLIRSILKEMNLNDKVYRPNAVQARISQAKNRLISPQAYGADRQTVEDDHKHHMPALREVYLRYCNRCRQADAMDFDDLLYYTHVLLRDHPDVTTACHDRFRYILVDEYQDTNYAQHRIVEQLTGPQCRVCVVGDDAQSIYSFRGAEIDNMLKFTDCFPGTRVFKLEQNYRSTQNIVNAANSLIAKNQRQIRKNVFSEKEEGNLLELLTAYSDVEEGEMVIGKVKELHRREQRSYADFALLYRTHAQSRIFEEALRRADIPYRIYGGLSFYQRKEVKDVIAYFRLVVNPNDEEALKRIINYPTRGIGDVTLRKIIEAAAEHGVSLWTALCNPTDYELQWTSGTAGKLQNFRNLIEGFMEHATTDDAYRAGSAIIQKAGIMTDLFKDSSPEGVARQENLEELVNGLSEFCNLRTEQGQPCQLSDFLSEVSLLTDQDSDKTSEESRVTLMTIHSAKGLEFPVVFVVGMEEGLFPNDMAGSSMRGLEEERRLFYVAVTRAETYCFLSYAKSRRRYGLMDFATPSRFLRDIDERYLSMPRSERSWGKWSWSGNSPRIKLEPVAQDDEGKEPPRSPANAFSARSTWAKGRDDDAIGTRRTSALKREREELHKTDKRPAWLSSSTPRSTPIRKTATTSSNSPTNGRNPYGIEPGQTVEHRRFGRGVVESVEGADESTKATINFHNAGVKQLLLRFANLKVVDS